MSKRSSVAAAVLAASSLFGLLGGGCALPGHRKAPVDPAERLVLLAAAEPDPEKAAAELKAYVKSDDVLHRAAAGQVLGAWAGAGDPRLAAPALAHADPLVRALAQAAYIQRNPDALGLLDVEGQWIEVRPEVLAALAEMHDPSGLGALEDLVEERRDVLRAYLDISPFTGVLAGDILARTGDAGARRRLLELLDSDAEAVLAVAAGASVHPRMGLGQTALVAVFRRGPAARRAAMRALVVQPNPLLRDLVLAGLQDEDLTVRRNAIRASAELGAAAPVDRLVAVLYPPEEKKKSGRNPPTTGEPFDALRALGVIGTPEAVEALRAYVQHGPPTQDLEVQALMALASHADRSDIAWVSRRLRSESPFIRAAAASVLGEVRHPSAQAALVLAMQDETPLVRAAVAKAIGQIGTEYAAAQLLTMLGDPAPQVRSMAAWGLGEAKAFGAVPALKEVALSDRSPPVPPRTSDVYNTPELAAILALGKIGNPAAVEVLAGLLDARSWIVRATAARALGTAKATDATVIEALRIRLKDPVNLVRGEALLALKALGQTFPPGYFQTH